MVETHGSRRFALFFLVAAFLLLLLGHWLRPVSNAVLVVAAPFSAAIDTIASGVGDGLSGVVEGPRLYNQNKALQRQVALLLQENIQLQQEKRENQILRRMVKFERDNTRMSYLTARVIGNDANLLAPFLFINKGARDGLKDGMTVVDQNGSFVGSISDLTRNAAKVLLLNSPSSSVGALDLKTQASGLVEGRFASAPQFHWVVESSTLHPGDLVVTSGQYNLYPRNLLIGQVTQIHRSNVAPFQAADVQTAADLQGLEIVEVIRTFVPSVPTKLINGH